MQRAWGRKELGLRSTEEVVRLREGESGGGRGESGRQRSDHTGLQAELRGLFSGLGLRFCFGRHAWLAGS